MGRVSAGVLMAFLVGCSSSPTEPLQGGSSGGDATSRDVLAPADAGPRGEDADASRDAEDAGLAADAGALFDALATYCADLTAISYRRRAECYGGSEEDYRVRDAESERYSGCAAVVEHVRAGRLVFDPALAAGSLRDLAASSCAEAGGRMPIRAWGYADNLLRVTGGALRGGLEVGQSCSSYWFLCPAETICLYEYPARQSFCRAVSVEVVQPGAACDQLHACDGWCEWVLGEARCGRPGRCLPLGGGGEACTAKGCVDSAYCDPATARCVATDGAEGSVCYAGGARSEASCARDDLSCAPSGDVYTCQRGARVGEACDDRLGPPCFGAYPEVHCVRTASTTSAGTCQLASAIGGACDEPYDTQCWTGTCVRGTCAVPRYLGDPCTSSEECSTGLCEAGACAYLFPNEPLDCR